MGQFVGRAIVTDGLVFQIDAANNLCGNVTNVKNIVNPTEISSFENGTSVVDNSYSFDGVNDYIDCGLSTNSKITDEITIECWAKQSAIQGGFIHIISRTPSYAIVVKDDDIGFYMNTTEVDTFNTTPIQDGEWHYLAVSYDSISGDYSIIVDDTVFSGNNVVAIPSAPTQELIIGARGDTLLQLWLGQISNVKIYNRALTPTEVAQNYEVQKHGYL
jgi:hypothetical protein